MLLLHLIDKDLLG